ncbi:apolipoprotein N-acyltransferase [Arcanobacterium hippocoleae]
MRWYLCAAKPPHLFSFLGTIILGAAVWIGIEQLRMNFPLGGMPWGNIAFSLTDSPLLSLARFGSTQLIQFFAVIIGLCFVFMFFALRKRKVFPGVVLGFTAFLLIAAPLGIPNLKLSGPQLKALVVQGNAPESFSGYMGGQRALEITENHVAATNAVFDQEVDVVIWPESASESDIRKDADARRVFRKTLRLIGETPILLGTQEYFANKTRTNDYLVYANGNIAGKYAKQHPVPFGEYVPWRKTIGKYFTEIEQISTDMIPGTDAAQLTIPLKRELESGSGSNISRVVAGTPICFEVAFDQIVAEAALGADFLIFPTNNSAFKRSGQAAQQFAIAKLRAVEHGKTSVQAAVSGITGVINPNGIVAYQTDLFTTDARIVPVQLQAAQTFATSSYQQRELLFYAFAILAAAVGLIRYVRFSGKLSSGADSDRQE